MAPDAAAPQRILVPLKEAAYMLGIHVASLRPYLDCVGVYGGHKSYEERGDPKLRGRIKTVKLGTRRFVVRESLDAFARELQGES